ncbi:MAG TPA: hypothetical protein VEQ16_05420 [Acidocella sp.]|jgi:hypothetical protein|nr:hypothetical protein [Acidocella sp.]
MKQTFRLALLLTPLLFLTACNPQAHAANQDFNAAGTSLGQGHIGSGAKDIGQGFSNGANATGQAITDTAHKIGQAFSE